MERGEKEDRGRIEWKIESGAVCCVSLFSGVGDESGGKARDGQVCD